MTTRSIYPKKDFLLEKDVFFENSHSHKILNAILTFHMCYTLVLIYLKYTYKIYLI